MQGERTTSPWPRTCRRDMGETTVGPSSADIIRAEQPRRALAEEEVRSQRRYEKGGPRRSFRLWANCLLRSVGSPWLAPRNDTAAQPRYTQFAIVVTQFKCDCLLRDWFAVHGSRLVGIGQDNPRFDDDSGLGVDRHLPSPRAALAAGLNRPRGFRSRPL